MPTKLSQEKNIHRRKGLSEKMGSHGVFIGARLSLPFLAEKKVKLQS